MKKLLALMLALMLALTSAPAFAQTVYTKLAVDTNQARGLISGFGVPEEQMGAIDAVLAAVNALGVRVTTVADGAQVDLSMNDADALSLGLATDDAGMTIVSTLFPNYALTLQNETVAAMMEQMAANMPGAGGGADMAAMSQVLGGYIQKWMEACAAAGRPGEPVPGDYEIEGKTFDTKVPVTVDMNAITAATNELLDNLLGDPAAMSMLQGMAQGMAQSSGAEFNPETFEADFKAGFGEWMAHFPDEVNAEIYAMSDGSETFFMLAESFREGDKAPFFTAHMLYENARTMSMGFSMEMTDDETSKTATMTAGFSMDGQNMQMFYDMGGMYVGLNISFPEGGMAFDVFFMNPDKPLLSVIVEITDDGERTLPVDAAGKTTLAVEEIMANANSEAAQGLLGDIMGNGIGALKDVATRQVPELGSLMGMAG